MSGVRKLADYLIFAYEKYTNSRFESSELKLQKLLYFAQRESIALTGEKLFEEDIEGWVYGPVIPEIRFFFEEGYSPVSAGELDGLSEKEMYIIENVIDQYAKYETWTLRDMSHEEYCWKKSRNGLKPTEKGFQTIPIEDIQVDAQKVRQYDHLWGMYLDEFEDDLEGGTYVQ